MNFYFVIWEFAGWHEVLEKCEVHIKDRITSIRKENSNLLPEHLNEKLSILRYEQVEEVDGLIHIYQRAKALKVNNSDTRDTIYSLSTQIIGWCMENNQAKEIQSFIDRPEKVIEWFIPQRTKELESKNIFLLEGVDSI